MLLPAPSFFLAPMDNGHHNYKLAVICQLSGAASSN